MAGKRPNKAAAHGKGNQGASYFLSLSLENMRCFGPKQTLDLSDGKGRPAQWTIILGENGTGKTTLLQVIAALAQDPRLDPDAQTWHPKLRTRWGHRDSPLTFWRSEGLLPVEVEAKTAMGPSLAKAGNTFQQRECSVQLRSLRRSASHVGYGDVEHFRPKAGYCQREGSPLRRPGYYWLAYAWDNLFFSCQLCNQRFKRNLFPLRNPRKRARSHHDAVNREEPLLIDPGRHDPARFLRFREEVVEALDENLVGATTINVLGLNRLELTEARRERLQKVKLLLRSRHLLAAQPATPEVAQHLKEIDALLPALTRDEAEYSAMMRALLGATGPAPSLPTSAGPE